MPFTARTMSVAGPDRLGVHAVDHSRNEKRPRSGPRLVRRQLVPTSSDTSTSRMPYPPSNAMPRSVTGRPRGTRVPAPGEAMNERTVMRVMGTVAAGAVPGSMQPHALSGMRYAGFIQNFSNLSVRTVISDRFFTQYVAYQPGTTRRAGKPFIIGRGWPFSF